MYNKELISHRFGKHFKSYDTLAVVQRQIATELFRLLSLHISNARLGVEIGSGTGFLTKQLVGRYPNCQWIINDLSSESKSYLPSDIKFIEGDGEQLQLPNDIDLLVSSSTMQWFDNLTLYIQSIKSHLATQGIVAISTFGTSNFKEITALTNSSLHYLTLNELTDCFDGFKILEKHIWEEVLIFDTPLDVLHHIKYTGLNAITTTRWNKSILEQFCKDYITLFGRATLTFNPIIIVAQKLS